MLSVDASYDQQQFQLPPKRFVSGGLDNKVVLWTFENNEFKPKEVGAHGDWVRDVAWCNNIGLVHDTIASCSEDQKVKIWRKEGKADFKLS